MQVLCVALRHFILLQSVGILRPLEWQVAGTSSPERTDDLKVHLLKKERKKEYKESTFNYFMFCILDKLTKLGLVWVE